MEAAAQRKCCFVSARHSPPLVLIAIPWIRRDKENRRNPCSLTNIVIKPRELERALGGVDVFIGHSLGGGAGAWCVREDGFRPKLFIALESDIHVGEHGPPVVVLMARFGEFASVIRTWLKAQTNAQVVASPWSEHITAAFDPVLVNAGVNAACADCWQTSARCSDRVAVESDRASAGNSGCVGLDVSPA